MTSAGIVTFHHEIIGVSDDPAFDVLLNAADVDYVDEEGNVIDKPKLPEKSAGGGVSGSNELQEKPAK